MKRIGISGIPSSGKTSLARSLASACGKKYRHIELISEYARQYKSKHKSIDTIWEQIKITDTQIEWEDNVASKTDLIITDSPIYLGFLYAIDLVNFENTKDIIAYNDLFKRLSQLSNRYDFVAHLNPVLQSVEDGVRDELHLNSKWREKSNSILLNLFNMFGQKNIVLIDTKEMDERVNICLNFIKGAQWD